MNFTTLAKILAFCSSHVENRSVYIRAAPFVNPSEIPNLADKLTVIIFWIEIQIQLRFRMSQSAAVLIPSSPTGEYFHFTTRAGVNLLCENLPSKVKTKTELLSRGKWSYTRELGLWQSYFFGTLEQNVET